MSRAWLALAAVAVSAMACGGGSAATSSPSPTPTASPSPSPTPSPAGLVFKLTPEPGVTAGGTVTVTPSQASVTLEVKVSGLGASSSHVSHIHNGTCQSRGGIAFSLSTVTADGQGDADAKTTLPLTYPPASGTWYVVVHAGPDMQGSNATYLLCANLFA